MQIPVKEKMWQEDTSPKVMSSNPDASKGFYPAESFSVY